MSDPKICENCRWWDSSVSMSGDPDTGACRIRDPRPDMRDGRARWPFTDADDWCGSFAAPPPTGSETEEDGS